MTKLLQSIMLAGLAALAMPALADDAAGALAPKQPADVSPTAPFITVDGTTLTNAYAEVVRGDLTRSGHAPTDENVRNVLIENAILAEEAARKGLDKPAEVQALLDLQRKDTLGKILLDDYAKADPISDERVKAEYDQLKAKVGDTEYHPRHILVASEAEALSIIQQIKARRAKFEDLAKKSLDTGSAAKGGDLGWMAPANLVPAFADAMVKLKKGEVTAVPVQTQYGWHVIQLMDTRKLEFPTLDQLKDRIANKLMQDDMRAYITDLRNKASVSPAAGN